MHPERPAATQVACRLLILRNIYISGYFVPPLDVLEELRRTQSEDEYRESIAAYQSEFTQLWKPIDNAQLADGLSPDEKQFIHTPVDQFTPRQLTDAFWRIESAQSLMWCLGILDTMPPFDTRAAEKPLQQPLFRNYSKLIQDSRLRPEAEIEASRKEAELWHWRSRTRELIERGAYPPSHPMFKNQPFDSLDGVVRIVAGQLASRTPPKPTIDEDFAAMGKAFRDLTEDEWCDVRSITIERHLAFNWVCGYAANNRWESTPTDT